MPERDTRAADVIRTVEAAGYIVHDGPCARWFNPYAVVPPGSVLAADVPDEDRRRILLAYRPEWGGDLPQVRMLPQEAAQFTGQDKYEHWGEAQALAYRLMRALEQRGAGLEEIDGHEPNCVFEVYPPITEEPTPHSVQP
ncbi:hypothetical protein ABZW18_31530 [Streptomyces sp. NPDC004647]|uniref:hypothetical protein n=1 Tax=Streptomyces sp. NPDC004647 TaxID=3154671 RepID=UPI0033AE06D6